MKRYKSSQLIRSIGILNIPSTKLIEDIRILNLKNVHKLQLKFADGCIDDFEHNDFFNFTEWTGLRVFEDQNYPMRLFPFIPPDKCEAKNTCVLDTFDFMKFCLFIQNNFRMKSKLQFQCTTLIFKGWSDEVVEAFEQAEEDYNKQNFFNEHFPSEIRSKGAVDRYGVETH